MSRFRVGFDLPRGQLYLAKGETFDVPDKPSRLGIGLLRRQGRTLVDFIEKDSAAEEAGVQVEDELVTVAHDEVAGMSLADVRWKLRTLSQFDDPLELQLRRAGADISVVVIPHE